MAGAGPGVWVGWKHAGRWRGAGCVGGGAPDEKGGGGGGGRGGGGRDVMWRGTGDGENVSEHLTVETPPLPGKRAQPGPDPSPERGCVSGTGEGDASRVGRRDRRGGRGRESRQKKEQ